MKIRLLPLALAAGVVSMLASGAVALGGSALAEPTRASTGSTPRRAAHVDCLRDRHARRGADAGNVVALRRSA